MHVHVGTVMIGVFVPAGVIEPVPRCKGFKTSFLLSPVLGIGDASWDLDFLLLQAPIARSVTMVVVDYPKVDYSLACEDKIAGHQQRALRSKCHAFG